MLRRVVFCLLLIAAAPACAEDGKERWALQARGITLMVFEIARGNAGWSATWEQPEHFHYDDDTFDSLSDAVVNRKARAVRVSGDVWEMSFDGLPNGPPVTFQLHRKTSARATLTFVGFGKDAVSMVRVTPAVRPGGWDGQQSYAVPFDRPTNVEMTAIFDADQAARKDMAMIDWQAMDREDDRRRLRTQALLDGEQLHSADDYYHAAFVFQHGHEPGDYLKAHALAVIAVSRGKTSATWIAAATLDRYLQAIGQAQVYGTQFSNRNGAWTQAPYRSDLLSDAVRQATRVPSIPEQDAQKLQYSRSKTMP